MILSSESWLKDRNRSYRRQNRAGKSNLGKMQAGHFSVKFLLCAPNGTKWSESATWQGFS